MINKIKILVGKLGYLIDEAEDNMKWHNKEGNRGEVRFYYGKKEAYEHILEFVEDILEGEI